MQVIWKVKDGKIYLESKPMYPARETVRCNAPFKDFYVVFLNNCL